MLDSSIAYEKVLDRVNLRTPQIRQLSGEAADVWNKSMIAELRPILEVKALWSEKGINDLTKMIDDFATNIVEELQAEKEKPT